MELVRLYEFIVQKEKEQAEVVWDQGVRIGERKEYQYKYSLYYVGGFYVEVVHDRIENKIEKNACYLSNYGRPFGCLEYICKSFSG